MESVAAVLYSVAGGEIVAELAGNSSAVLCEERSDCVAHISSGISQNT